MYTFCKSEVFRPIKTRKNKIFHPLNAFKSNNNPPKLTFVYNEYRQKLKDIANQLKLSPKFVGNNFKSISNDNSSIFNSKNDKIINKTKTLIYNNNFQFSSQISLKNHFIRQIHKLNMNNNKNNEKYNKIINNNQIIRTEPDVLERLNSYYKNSRNNNNDSFQPFLKKNNYETIATQTENDIDANDSKGKNYFSQKKKLPVLLIKSDSIWRENFFIKKKIFSKNHMEILNDNKDNKESKTLPTKRRVNRIPKIINQLHFNKKYNLKNRIKLGTEENSIRKEMKVACYNNFEQIFKEKSDKKNTKYLQKNNNEIKNINCHDEDKIDVEGCFCNYFNKIE